jgi:ribonuclease HIII
LLGPDLLEELRARLKGRGWVEASATSGYEAFRLVGPRGVVVAYSSGVVVMPEDEGLLLLVEDLLSARMRWGGRELVVGADEAGKGEWLGPLVVAAVALDKRSWIALQARGVMDSKRLPVARIRALAREVRRLARGFKTSTIAPEEFNRQVSEGRGLNALLAEAHAKNIQGLLDYIPAGWRVEVVVDRFTAKPLPQPLNALRNRRVHVVQQYQGERNMAVAAASILARATREEEIERLSGELGLELRALTPAEALGHPAAARFAKLAYLKKMARKPR